MIDLQKASDICWVWENIKISPYENEGVSLNEYRFKVINNYLKFKLE